jgi:chitin synthase
MAAQKPPLQRGASLRERALARPPPSLPTPTYTLLSMDPHRRVGDGNAPARPTFHAVSRAKVLITVTAFNEESSLISETLFGVLENVAELLRLREEALQGRPPGDYRLAAAAAALAPADIVTLVVLDGRKKMHPSLFGKGGLLSSMPDAAQRMEAAAGALPPRPRDSEVRDLHLFELPWTQERGHARPFPAGASLTLLIGVKEANGGKLNSHAWALRGLAPFLAPDFHVLLDAGTVPAPTAVLRLLGGMLAAPDIGGCCGEICVAYEQRSLFSPVVQAQVFEYTSSNAIDKAFESLLGFIGVLPGAFSAYRAAAIGDPNGGEPLSRYFMLEGKDAIGMAPAIANMYLAEDRILGFEIVATRGAQWRLWYDAGAQAFTDVPSTVGGLVKQRRRWLNGSFFATLYMIQNWARLLPGGGTRHPPLRQLGFFVLLVWHILNVLLAWFTLGNSYFALRMIVGAVTPAVATSGSAASVVAQSFVVLTWV